MSPTALPKWLAASELYHYVVTFALIEIKLDTQSITPTSAQKPTPSICWHQIKKILWSSPFPADSRRVVVSYMQKYVHQVMVNRLVKLAQEKCS